MAANADLYLIPGLCVFAVMLAAGSHFLLTWSRTIRHIRPRNRHRRLSPEKVWLCLIPLAGAVIALRLVTAMTVSLRWQFVELDEDDPWDTYGLDDGQHWCYMLIPSWLIVIASIIVDFPVFVFPPFAILIGICFISWICYWIAILHCHRRLKELVPAQYSADELDYGDNLASNEED